MKKSLHILLALLVLASAVPTVATAQVRQQKCPTCGKSYSECPYKFEHPKKTTSISGKGKQQAQPKKCPTCGKPLDKCQYGGKHPAKCSTCGKTVDMCQYGGKHPKCTTCGKTVDYCQYNGNHPAPEPAAYEVSLTSNVSDATIYIDGVNYGTASGSRMLKPGSHTIKLTADGYRDYDNSIIVDRNNTQFYFSMTLEPRRLVKGKIVDASFREPIIGAAVKVQGTNRSAVSKSDGSFSIEVKDGDVLDVSFVGYSPQCVIIEPGQTEVYVVLRDLSYRILKGVVTDSHGEPLIGATIVFPGTRTGTFSDLDGYFSIAVKDGDELSFSYVGHKKKTIKIQKGQNELKVVLK